MLYMYPDTFEESTVEVFMENNKGHIADFNTFVEFTTPEGSTKLSEFLAPIVQRMVDSCADMLHESIILSPCGFKQRLYFWAQGYDIPQILNTQLVVTFRFGTGEITQPTSDTIECGIVVSPYVSHSHNHVPDMSCCFGSEFAIPSTDRKLMYESIKDVEDLHTARDVPDSTAYYNYMLNYAASSLNMLQASDPDLADKLVSLIVASPNMLALVGPGTGDNVRRNLSLDLDAAKSMLEYARQASMCMAIGHGENRTGMH